MKRKTIPFPELHTVYGVEYQTLRKWITRNRFPIGLIHDVDTASRTPYQNAWVYEGEALHWGRANGVLNPDGTPNTSGSDAQRGRNMADATRSRNTTGGRQPRTRKHNPDNAIV